MARDVLVVLAAHAGRPNGPNPGIAWPSIDQIANTLRVTPKRVQNAIAELKAAGLVKVHSRNRRLRETNLYELAIDDEPYQVPDVSTESPSETGARCEHPITAESSVSGARIHPDQVPDSVPNQFSNSCSHGAENRPLQPTREPSVLTTFAPPDALRARTEKEKQRDDREHGSNEADRSLLMGLLAQATSDGNEGVKVDLEYEADRLLRRHTRAYERARLLGHLRRALLDPSLASVAKKITWADLKTQRGEDPIQAA